MFGLFGEQQIDDAVSSHELLLLVRSVLIMGKVPISISQFVGQTWQFGSDGGTWHRAIIVELMVMIITTIDHS